MRLAVTGAGGGLGRAFLQSVGPEHEVHAFTRQELDVRDTEAVLGALVPVGPDVVFHLAAMTSVDGCETDPRRAAETNVLGTANVAAAARGADALLVALSTDYVFDGLKGSPYDERDQTNPLSVYAWTKLGGEAAAAAIAPEHLIVRTAWVFGAGNDFVSGSVRKLAAGETIGAIVDRIGSPTYVEHLAQRLIPLAGSGLRGIVHLGGPEAVTWHDVVVRAKQLGNLPGEILEQKNDELDRPAPRPVNSSLTSVVLPGAGVPPMPPLDEAIQKVLSRVGV
ncbi:MAG TPA: dTDP-4-dehydrorhamnose reductase [Actinomycetota bacterium]|nr:dTDP-4-dehydrorhamnose reductase [Actinomycetota bacterium]